MLVVAASAIVCACASSAPSPVYNTTDPTAFAPRCLSPLRRSFKHCLDARVKELPTDYRLLARHLDELGAAHVLLTQYPDETTGADGKICDGTGRFPKLEAPVWLWLKQVGDELNRAVAGTSSLGWTPVTGIPEGFVGHGYCSTDSYFRSIVESAQAQTNAYGSFHATAAGQAITFAHTRDAACKTLYGNPACDGNPPSSG
jgi:hypothetical protein